MHVSVGQCIQATLKYFLYTRKKVGFSKLSASSVIRIILSTSLNNALNGISARNPNKATERGFNFIWLLRAILLNWLHSGAIFRILISVSFQFCGVNAAQVMTCRKGWGLKVVLPIHELSKCGGEGVIHLFFPYHAWELFVFLGGGGVYIHFLG